MKSICKIVNDNRGEAIKFLKERGGEYTFIEYDTDAMEWIDPRYNGDNEDDKYCYAEDAAPFVTMDDDGDISEYIVKKIFIDDSGKFDILCVGMVSTTNFADYVIVPISYLYGYAEQYIYEMLMNLEGLEND